MKKEKRKKNRNKKEKERKKQFMSDILLILLNEKTELIK